MEPETERVAIAVLGVSVEELAVTCDQQLEVGRAAELVVDLEDAVVSLE